MKYVTPQGNLDVPNDIVKKYCQMFNVSKDEACQIWAEEEGYLDNEEQQALEKKAKENKITATIHGAEKDKPRKKRTVTKKEDVTKKRLIQAIEEMLHREGAVEVDVINPEKLIQFSIENDRYEIDLKRKRPSKNGTKK